jgi:F-box and leucine-rich repeat protein 2/20
VSHAWRQLAFDGQLWAKLDLRSFPKLPAAVLVQLAQTAGGFVRCMDLSGHAGLYPEALEDISHSLAVHSDGLTRNYLTYINLQGCYRLTTRSLHHILTLSPSLKKLNLKGQPAVRDATCKILAEYCPELQSLNLSRCRNMTAEGIRCVAAAAVSRGEQIPLKELRVSGLRVVNDDMMIALGRAAPFLEVLDLSYTTVHNSAIEAFVVCMPEDNAKFSTVQLTSREAGRDPADPARHWRRVTRLRHLNLSSCLLLTDHACSHLAHTVPRLEFLELAGIGPELRDDGLVRLLSTTPHIRRLDLEDATEVTDRVLHALTPATPPPTEPTPISGTSSARPSTSSPARQAPEPGHALEHLTLSYANVESDAVSELIRACPRLRVLEADNTRMTGLVLREFVQTARRRNVQDAKVVAVDCRAVGEHAVKELAAVTRPRMGWRSWHARKLAYLDGRDDEGLAVGQDECDPSRIVVKTFYSWQTVDSVKAAREKKRLTRSRRGANASGESTASDSLSSAGRARWWSPSGRRSAGPNTPTLLDHAERNGEGCTIM